MKLSATVPVVCVHVLENSISLASLLLASRPVQDCALFKEKYLPLFQPAFEPMLATYQPYADHVQAAFLTMFWYRPYHAPPFCESCIVSWYIPYAVPAFPIMELTKFIPYCVPDAALLILSVNVMFECPVAPTHVNSIPFPVQVVLAAILIHAAVVLAL